MAAAQGDPCLISVPSALGFFLGSGCIYSKTNARALIAGGMIVAGSVIVLAGVALLAAEGFQRSGAAAALRGNPVTRPVFEITVRDSGQRGARQARVRTKSSRAEVRTKSSRDKSQAAEAKS